MGRLVKTEQSISGNTDVHIFIDEYGNVTQIFKKDRESRLKFYIDPNAPQADYVIECVIGASDSVNNTDCAYGIGLGIGDDTWARVKY